MKSDIFIHINRMDKLISLQFEFIIMKIGKEKFSILCAAIA
jgi:hypothetical protein